MSKNIEIKDESLCLKKKLKKALNEHMEKTRIPKQRRSIETKMQIVNASMRLFSQKGFYNTNTKEIAQEAGVATGCFYSYFDDKRAVFLEALKIYNQQFDDTLFGQLREVVAGKKDKRELLEAVFRGVINAHEVFSGFHNELIIMKYSDPDITRLMADKMKQSRAATLELIKMYASEIKVKDIEAASIVIFDLIDGVVDTMIFSDVGVDKNRLMKVGIDMIVDYLFI